MKKFQEYCENREHQFSHVQKILNHLQYGKGLDLEAIAQMNISKLTSILNELGLGNRKEALWVKSVASGGTDLSQDLRRTRNY